MAREVRQRKGKVPPRPPEIDADLPESSAVRRIASGIPTPRSTLGSPLTSNAAYRRSGVGDLAAGPRRHISLSEVELLPWLCCMTPAFCLFANYSAVLISMPFFPVLADLLTLVLTCIMYGWLTNLAISSILGAVKLREGTSTDWHTLLKQLPEEDRKDVRHIVLLPNFKENERMLKDTLDNLARSRLAKKAVQVVLAMEAREGQPGREKAERIIAEKKHLFLDMFATYHPEGVQGEVAGKSSNTQWAFREALRRYGACLSGLDLSKVFLTVADADTLLHPQYFSALTYQGLLMEKEERSWAIWQSPVLLVRNIFGVPAFTRASSHATLIFELSALANQYIFPAFAYSAYSMTLALASHPEVDGWDVDVIAEDHHMFCKCYFAALWELAHAAKESTRSPALNEAQVQITPQVQVQPIFLPAVSYLVESNEGYIASLYARFQQARRHSQGVVELGYVVLQWARLSKETGVFNIPFRTHLSIAMIAIKMHTLHITSTCQCFALILVAVTRVIPRTLSWAFAGGVQQLLQDTSSVLASFRSDYASMSSLQQILYASISQISSVMVLYSLTCSLVIIDLVEGRYYKCAESLTPRSPSRSMTPVVENENSEAVTTSTASEEEDVRSPGEPSAGDSNGVLGFEFDFSSLGPRSWAWRIGMVLYVCSDTMLAGYPALFFFAMVPVLLAGWSLFRRGTDFEYIVAAKPE